MKHSTAIMVLEFEIQDCRTTKLRCQSYGDPQDQIDAWDTKIERLQAAIDDLKAMG